MATFSTTFTLSANAGALSPSATSLTKAATEYCNKDTSVATMTLAAGETQTVYQPTDASGSIPDLSYLYISAQSVDTSSYLTVTFKSGSTSTVISRLKDGDFMYMPFKTQNGAGCGPTSSSITLTNNSAGSTASVYFVFAESGSL